MARTLLVAGTASHVGKSTVAAGLCRLLADRGVSVAPFKAQNMSNNARAVPRAEAVTSTRAVDEEAATGDGTAFGEIGVSQYVQARAARVPPSTDHNPVLLKPRGGGESQLVVDGEAVGHFAAGDYYDRHWERAREAALAAHDRLAADHEVVVAEGAGSIAEINLHHRDLANVELARAADADVLLVADIERGGVFASLVGTLELLPEDLRDQVVGAVITKFRGDPTLLDDGLTEFEARTGVPILGVLPYDDPDLPEEDSVALPPEGECHVLGADEGVPAERSVTVAVPRLPHVSNFTDLEPLAAVPGVRVAYVPLDVPLDTDGVDGARTDGVDETGTDADAVVLPGTKNTVDDLRALHRAGMIHRLRAFDGPIVGLCGGYQMLGERITGAGVESTVSDLDSVDGAGLLPVETEFSPEKRVEATRLRLHGTGPLAGADGTVEGYEIHMGETRVADGEGAGDVHLPFAPEADGTNAPATAALGAARGDVVGTYLHGLFENERVVEAFVDRIYDAAGRERPDGDEQTVPPYDRAASLVADHVDMDALGFGEVGDVQRESSGHTNPDS